MKKLLSLTLVLLLVAFGASAVTVDLPDLSQLLGGSGEEVSIKVVEDSFLGYSSELWGFDSLYIAVFENTSGKDHLVYMADLQGLNKDGQVVFTKMVYNISPYLLRNGEKAIAVGNNLGITQEEYEAMDSWKLVVTGSSVGVEEGYDTLLLPVQAEYSQTSQDDYVGGLLYEGLITLKVDNNTEQPLFDPASVALLRNKDGKLVAGINMSTYDVGILPGSGILQRGIVADDLIEGIMAQGHEVATVEAVTYINIQPEF